MKTLARLLAGAALVIGLFTAPVLAQSLFYFGEIGGAPVFASLMRVGDKLTGSYVYLRQPKPIDLRGDIDAGALALEEVGSAANRKAASFKGEGNNSGWSGIWRAPDGRQVAFSLRRDRDPLSGLSGRFRCTTSQSDEGYTFRNALDLRVAKGRVTALTFSARATSESDEQSCSIAMSDLRAIAAEAGITLRAKKDDETDVSESALHCILTIRGSGDYLVISTQGCHGAGDEMFCSARGGWPDLVLDRKTQACKTME